MARNLGHVLKMKRDVNETIQMHWFFFSLFFFLLKVIVSSMSGYEAVNVCIYLVSGCIYIFKSTLPESPNKFLKIRVKFIIISIDPKSLSVDTSPRSQVIRLVSVFQSHAHSPTDILSLGEFNTFHISYALNQVIPMLIQGKHRPTFVISIGELIHSCWSFIKLIWTN